MRLRLLENVSWNLSRSANRRFESADCIVISIPKSGRTWTRFFLNTYFASKCGVDPSSDAVSGLPGASVVIFTHDYFQNIWVSRFMFKLKGNDVVPRRLRRTKPILLIARDPRDAVVSLYFHSTRRDVERDNKRSYQGSIGEFIHDPSRGIENMVRIMNIWAEEFLGREHVLLVNYETLRADPATGFHKILDFVLHARPVDSTAFDCALEASSFERMQEVERKIGESKPIFLEGRNPDDPESFKVRKGKVGGFRDYLPEEEIEFMNASLKLLDPRYGYVFGGVVPLAAEIQGPE